MRRESKMRPEGAPKLGETYRDWRDFTNRVARPWVEGDCEDPKADAWYRTLFIEREPFYLACALVMADNRIRAWRAAMSDVLSEADCTCVPGEGCDEEGDPGCAYCRSIDCEWPCPAESDEYDR